MATIKSYTDLSQSKTLSKILPLDSADFFHVPDVNIVVTQSYIIDCCGERCIPAYPDTVPCWSLAALLGVLPRVDIEKEICSDDTYDYRVKAYIGGRYAGDWYDNPIDACYEMVLKLHEQKLL